MGGARTWPKRLAVGISAATCMVACALTLEPGPYTTTCSFAGRGETDCGRCIADKCQVSVDACCATEGCRGALVSLDACGSGQGCSLLLASATSIATCVATQCPSACVSQASGDGGPVVDAEPETKPPARTFCSSFSGGRDCTCSAETDPNARNAERCDTTTVGDGVCCAEPGFPRDQGATCKCYSVGCTGGDGNCLCGLGIRLNRDHTCRETQCCLSADRTSCRCRGTCFREEKSVTGCPQAEYACPTGQRVTTCSP